MRLRKSPEIHPYTEFGDPGENGRNSGRRRRSFPYGSLGKYGATRFWRIQKDHINVSEDELEMFIGENRISRSYNTLRSANRHAKLRDWQFIHNQEIGKMRNSLPLLKMKFTVKV
jgi:hypothetical protein